jgi:hypothetical protein
MLTAEKEIFQRASLKMNEKEIPFGEALLLVAKEDPELVSEYRKDVLKSQTVFEAPPTKEEFKPSPMATELTRLARDKVKRDGVTFGEALRSVARERPGLCSDYQKEVSKSKA